jgi:hypothetical protein
MIEKKVSVDFLKPGMYVSNLDRPWVETDFLFQGFLIKNQREIDKLKNIVLMCLSILNAVILLKYM